MIGREVYTTGDFGVQPNLMNSFYVPFFDGIVVSPFNDQTIMAAVDYCREQFWIYSIDRGRPFSD